MLALLLLFTLLNGTLTFVPRGLVRNGDCQLVGQQERRAQESAMIWSSVRQPHSHSTASATELIAISLGPPDSIRSLKLGESMLLVSPDVRLERIAQVPDMFVIRNFLPHAEDRLTLMKMGESAGFQNAETKCGDTMHRIGSSVAFLPAGDGMSNPPFAEIGQDVVEFMTAFSSQFIHESLRDEHNPENLQIAKYSTGGKFDIHHDGRSRVVTVLTYLNGIADTWFPYASPEGYTKSLKEDDEPPEMVLEGEGMAAGKVPGEDGVWVIGKENESSATNPKTVRINAGDAIVFYNYEYSVEFACPVMNWRSLHAGRPAKSEKWIATNWIASKICETPERYKKHAEKST